MASIPIAVRSSSGLNIHLGPPQFGDALNFNPVETKLCRCVRFSPDGTYLAYVTGQVLKILETNSWEDVAVIESTKTNHIAFSPKGTFLMSWEPFTINNVNPQSSPNLKIYKSENGQLVKSFIHKKQGNWEPQWSADEKLFCRMINTDVVFYEDHNFERITSRIDSYKIASYKISPNVGTYFIICHTCGNPGQPSFGRLFKYPNFDGQQAIANKSFFQADKVDFYWNLKGNNALLLTSTEVDKTGESYYGKQGLYFAGLNGHTSLVMLNKQGPIYSVAWSPKNQEFCVIYGFMPAKGTIFNLKCESIFELGSGPRNSIYYNPHGNLLLIGGFGNLRGQIEIWDAVNKRKIAECNAPDSTLLQWAEDGEHFLTATTAPRLRIGNGYKLWHYSGVLLFEKPCLQQELYEIFWKNYPQLSYPEPIISLKKIEGIISSQPQASTQVYRPPSARNRLSTIKFKLYDDMESTYRPGQDSSPSKASLKQKKKRDAKKAKKMEEGIEVKGPAVVSSVQVKLTGDPELDKKRKNIKKKLDAIEKLKSQQAQGKSLEINQLDKIKCEAELLNELEKLAV